ncbi:MAG: aminotransferase class I/II-fold pyridoxal phosphate-dependent enzyme [Chlorogloeopsis fritschii C42_A2020_084]|uniref:aminotransferase class I/II-fold pyridoxal phosphate-dependent enzyme n=1 Tax=Chlorogloeopsis fritschii TaxID=1124 RepID=UPI001A0EB2F7|nr:aminotransferase class I/II-fold pyridoxal phosphate-dependent enzyme [Chlorogloeopsis fritschii]MBF2004328.1 aminotransferase class I/II-fold pyridoxal phosphate-dependent enzyme [Chlorogloeopsis fritschii C42_A2020_084]
MKKPILLSTPHIGDRELEFVKEAFDTNWIAPVGPHIDAFEEEFCQVTGADYAAALASGTAALHLALQLVGIERGDEVFCSTLTFAASANPIVYLGAKPVFIDSDRTSWNMNPDLLQEALEKRARIGKLPKAVIVVHLYGQSADIDPILKACNQYDIPLIEDAAEALGATYKGRSPGTFGRIGIYSFNGNKIITTSGGGMLVSNNSQLVAKARFLATQARDPAPHYQHSEIGYNYRLSNVSAGIGRGQLRVLKERVASRQRNFRSYASTLGILPGIEFMPEANYGCATRWLTCLTIDPKAFGADREQVRLALAAQQIESRPVWKPLHLQPVFAECECFGGAVAENLFTHGLCLPSGSNLTDQDLERVIDEIIAVHYVSRKTEPLLIF